MRASFPLCAWCSLFPSLLLSLVCVALLPLSVFACLLCVTSLGLAPSFAPSCALVRSLPRVLVLSWFVFELLLCCARQRLSCIGSRLGCAVLPDLPISSLSSSSLVRLLLPSPPSSLVCVRSPCLLLLPCCFGVPSISRSLPAYTCCRRVPPRALVA